MVTLKHGWNRRSGSARCSAQCSLLFGKCLWKPWGPVEWLGAGLVTQPASRERNNVKVVYVLWVIYKWIWCTSLVLYCLALESNKNIQNRNLSICTFIGLWRDVYWPGSLRGSPLSSRLGLTLMKRMQRTHTVMRKAKRTTAATDRPTRAPILKTERFEGLFRTHSFNSYQSPAVLRYSSRCLRLLLVSLYEIPIKKRNQSELDKVKCFFPPCPLTPFISVLLYCIRGCLLISSKTWTTYTMYKSHVSGWMDSKLAFLVIISFRSWLYLTVNTVHASFPYTVFIWGFCNKQTIK